MPGSSPAELRRQRQAGPVLLPASAHRLRPREAPRPSPVAPKNKDVAALLDGLNALGLTTATAAQVDEVTKELFPQGTDGLDQAEVLRAVFLHLKRQNRADKVGR